VVINKYTAKFSNLILFKFLSNLYILFATYVQWDNTLLEKKVINIKHL